MAGLALLAEAPFMRVVLLVTSQASGRRIAERAVLVAIDALQRGVLASQREASLIVIEARFLPRVFSVAVGAFSA